MHVFQFIGMPFSLAHLAEPPSFLKDFFQFKESIMSRLLSLIFLCILTLFIGTDKSNTVNKCLQL